MPITENTVVRNNALAVKLNLRGYDATHLAYDLVWQETLGMPVTLVSFDSQLIEAARGVQMAYIPIRTAIELLMHQLKKAAYGIG